MAVKRYARLYQEYDFIFLGDNGQGDLLAGQLMMEAHEISVGSTENGPKTMQKPMKS